MDQQQPKGGNKRDCCRGGFGSLNNQQKKRTWAKSRAGHAPGPKKGGAPGSGGTEAFGSEERSSPGWKKWSKIMGKERAISGEPPKKSECEGNKKFHKNEGLDRHSKRNASGVRSKGRDARSYREKVVKKRKQKAKQRSRNLSEVLPKETNGVTEIFRKRDDDNTKRAIVAGKSHWDGEKGPRRGPQPEQQTSEKSP